MKFSQESIILIIATIMIGGLIFWKSRGEQTSAISPVTPVDTYGGFPADAAPAYTSYNTANAFYNLGPPVINVMPSQTMGVAGGAKEYYGCNSCG